ncbi:hypothetical protein [Kallotenue papyrolyticum]|uniref:hypothetical protein n=1 Tax=Kallotenue papyrolyticum TaxID=1325125 RepID=UPI0004786548|nr:hypothetical protein [Kallotenue papyrolyticum]
MNRMLLGGIASVTLGVLIGALVRRLAASSATRPADRCAPATGVDPQMVVPAREVDPQMVVPAREVDPRMVIRPCPSDDGARSSGVA